MALSAAVQPESASNAVVWNSGNTKVATVDENGVVTAAGALGSATITATAMDGSKKTAKCSIKVVQPVKALALTSPQSALIAGKTLQLKAALTPSNAAVKTIEWSFEASDALRPYITLTNGKLTVSRNMPPNCAGAVTVTATAVGCAVPISESLSINAAAPVASMTMYADGVAVTSEDKGELWLGEKNTLQLSTVISPAEACRTVTWKSSSPKVAAVDADGQVTAVGKGTAVITATSDDGTEKSVKYTITVGVPAVDVTVTAPKLYAAKGGSVTPKAAVFPSNANNKKVVWSISPLSDTVRFNPMTGKIDVLKNWNGIPAQVTLTAAVSGTAKTVQSSVTIGIVSSLAKSVKIYDSNNKAVSSAIMSAGGAAVQYHAVVLPEDANRIVTWTSSAPDIVSVDQNGLVTPVSEGTATITATSADGAKTAKLKITVK